MPTPSASSAGSPPRPMRSPGRTRTRTGTGRWTAASRRGTWEQIPDRVRLVPAMELTNALEFVREHRNAVLATQRANGRPQLSNVIYALGDDGLVRVSITADRAKAHNA